MDPILAAAALSVVLGAVIAFVFFKSHLLKQRSNAQAISEPELHSDPKKTSKPQHVPKKYHSKPHSHASDKEQSKRHHPLDLNTLKGHADSVTGMCFSSDGRNLATACADGVVRVFKLDDASSKSFKINVPLGGHAVAVAFADDSSSIVVASQTVTGCSLYMYGEENPKKGSTDSNQQSKLPLPQVKWEHHKIHDKQAILTLTGATASYGTGDGSTIIASCSEGTDILLWHGRTGKVLGHVDTNQLKNTMATISPNGRFLAAAAFTADVKIWEIAYAKDGSVKEVLNSAVTWLCFSPNSEQIITTSKDGSIRVWNINGLSAPLCLSPTYFTHVHILVLTMRKSMLMKWSYYFVPADCCKCFVEVRYHLSEDPKTLKVFPIPLHDSSGSALHYDRLSLSPDGKILAATRGPTLRWLCLETGKVLDTAEKAHDGDITWITWSPKTMPLGNEQVVILATASVDKKVKLWAAPSVTS
ncbi:transducin beta-like protein 2 [Gossypium australe]|uniref:Transducin beta-like protein 2 n=1 Tax=Gossypium australe TaxID=47621 RepID=A0A5B6VS47_9ROSI|nr:transducin beta-like protein 2 [Gossypium australe]